MDSLMLEIDGKLAVVEKGGLIAIHRVLELHPQHLGLLSQACLAIGHLAANGFFLRLSFHML
jgi:hypothetical protein